MRVPHGPARPQRERGLGAFQRLNRRLLIDTEHDRVFGRVQIEPDDIGDLGGECRIPTHFIGAHEVRFYAVRAEDVGDTANRPANRRPRGASSTGCARPGAARARAGRSARPSQMARHGRGDPLWDGRPIRRCLPVQSGAGSATPLPATGPGAPRSPRRPGRRHSAESRGLDGPTPQGPMLVRPLLPASAVASASFSRDARGPWPRIRSRV